MLCNKLVKYAAKRNTQRRMNRLREKSVQKTRCYGNSEQCIQFTGSVTVKQLPLFSSLSREISPPQ